VKQSTRQYVHRLWTYLETCHEPCEERTWVDRPWTEIDRCKWRRSSAAAYSETWYDVPYWIPPTGPHSHMYRRPKWILSAANYNKCSQHYLQPAMSMLNACPLKTYLLLTQHIRTFVTVHYSYECVMNDFLILGAIEMFLLTNVLTYLLTYIKVWSKFLQAEYLFKTIMHRVTTETLSWNWNTNCKQLI